MTHLVTPTSAFFVPMAGYLGVALFALMAGRARRRVVAAEGPAAAH